MYYLGLIRQFAKASIQNELAYRANFWLSLFHSVLNLVTGILGVAVLFDQVETIRGWDMASTLTLLGVYLILSALRGLFIAPSLDALAGMDGEIWTGKFDFTLLRPVDAQFLASFQHWRPFALVDLGLGLGVLGIALVQLGSSLAPDRILTFSCFFERSSDHPVRHPTGLLGPHTVEFQLFVHLGPGRVLSDGALSGRPVPPLAPFCAHLDHPRGCDDDDTSRGADGQDIGRCAGRQRSPGSISVPGRLVPVPVRSAALCQRVELRH